MNRKIFMYFIIILIILFVIGIGFKIITNQNKNYSISEYIPEEEISEEQLRKTNITLFFYDKRTEELGTEIRQIDSKQLLDNPERLLIEYLIEGPKDETLTKLFPENTKLINYRIEKDIIYLNFSEEFINNENTNETEQRLLIKSILKTIIQLNEINGIKIIINGNENMNFIDSEINFKNIFTNKDF